MSRPSPRRSLLARLAVRPRAFFRRPSAADLDDEIRGYVRHLVGGYIDRGLSPADARRRALAEVGVEQVKEATRDVYPWHTAQAWWRDVYHATRSLRRAPGFALTATITLGLCVGSSVTVLAVMYAVLWRALPYPDSERLVTIVARFGTVSDGGLAPNEVGVIRGSSAFARVGLVNGAEAFLTVDDQMERVSAASASDAVLPMLGAEPMSFGRTLDSTVDAGPEWVRAAVISHRLWRQMFASDPAIIGRRARINDMDLAIVGVLPPGFRSWLPPSSAVDEETDVWFPRMEGDGWSDRTPGVIARLAPGVGIGQARAELAAISTRLATDHPQVYVNAAGPLELDIRSLRDIVAAPARRQLLGLAVSVSFVLLLGCASLANLTLARSASRRAEVAIRAALGGGRLRLFRWLIAEHAVIGAAGGALAVALMYAVLTLVPILGAEHLPRAGTIGAGPGLVSLCLGLAMTLMFACGALPAAWLARRQTPTGVLSTQTALSGAGTRRLQRVLVVAEIALSVAPLFGAGLLLGSLVRLGRVDLGFEHANVATAKVGISPSRYPSAADRWHLYRDVTDRLAGLPGVEAVSGVSPVPFEPAAASAVRRFRREDSSEPIWARQQAVLAGYLHVVRASLVEGRDLTVDDLAAARDVAIVDENFARLMWSGSAMGRRFVAGTRSLEVVGVVRSMQLARVLDAERSPVRSERLPLVVVPYHVWPVPMTMVIRTVDAASTAAVVPALEQAVETLGVTRAVYDVRPLTAYVADSIRESRLSAVVLAAFAGAALLLSVVGLYGTLAYLVGLRTQEFALRLALGASLRQVAASVAGEGAVITAVGVAIGMAGAWAVGRAIAGSLYGVGPLDPGTLAGVALVLGAAAGVAVFHPTWRATRVDPVIMLRGQ